MYCNMIVSDQLLEIITGCCLMCKNLRAMKVWTLSEIEQKHRLQWAHEVPGNWKSIEFPVTPP